MKRRVLGATEASRSGYSHYMQRKIDELALIEERLAHPPPPPQINHLGALLNRKFKSAALCRAELAAAQWSQTETRWKSGPCGSGAFLFDYEYQRADLAVVGPPAYSIRGLEKQLLATQYTTSGMAALAASLLAVQRLWPGCSFEARADGYPETRELIELLGVDQHDGSARVGIVDSTVDTPLAARTRLKDAAVAIFDTSCFAASSSRIRAITTIARDLDVPLILIRSHTKLDCLGLDYGRLGSVVVTKSRAAGGPELELNRLITDFIRLTGAAALPLHFPPFASGEIYRSLSRARSTWTIRCTRLIDLHLRRFVELDVRSFSHGLYIVFYPSFYARKEEASEAAAGLVARLMDDDIPARHAGSFGFDFFGCDWFEDPESGRIGLRLSVGDLPLCLIERAIGTIEQWLDATLDAATVEHDQHISGTPADKTLR
ncbi:MAG: hypothetical protein K2Q28_16805 [Hyphomicrobium sp.]|nr:hypothetical protein [Hyphomicrobium sp.]